MRIESRATRSYSRCSRRPGSKCSASASSPPDDQTLDSVSKKQRFQEIEDHISTMRQYGLNVFGLFIGGFEKDTEQTFTRIVDFALRHDMVGINIMVLGDIPIIRTASCRAIATSTATGITSPGTTRRFSCRGCDPASSSAWSAVRRSAFIHAATVRRAFFDRGGVGLAEVWWPVRGPPCLEAGADLSSISRERRARPLRRQRVRVGRPAAAGSTYDRAPQHRKRAAVHGVADPELQRSGTRVLAAHRRNGGRDADSEDYLHSVEWRIPGLLPSIGHARLRHARDRHRAGRGRL